MGVVASRSLSAAIMGLGADTLPLTPLEYRANGKAGGGGRARFACAFSICTIFHLHQVGFEGSFLGGDTPQVPTKVQDHLLRVQTVVPGVWTRWNIEIIQTQPNEDDHFIDNGVRCFM